MKPTFEDLKKRYKAYSVQSGTKFVISFDYWLFMEMTSNHNERKNGFINNKAAELSRLKNKVRNYA